MILRHGVPTVPPRRLQCVTCPVSPCDAVVPPRSHHSRWRVVENHRPLFLKPSIHPTEHASRADSHHSSDRAADTLLQHLFGHPGSQRMAKAVLAAIFSLTLFRTCLVLDAVWSHHQGGVVGRAAQGTRRILSHHSHASLASPRQRSKPPAGGASKTRLVTVGDTRVGCTPRNTFVCLPVFAIFLNQER